MAKSFNQIAPKSLKLDQILDFGHYYNRNTSEIVLENYNYFLYLQSVGYKLTPELRQAVEIQGLKAHNQLLSEIEEDVPF